MVQQECTQMGTDMRISEEKCYCGKKPKKVTDDSKINKVT